MRDCWAEWILERRFGGDPEELERQKRFLAPVRDRVLDGADVKSGDVLVDVGAGDGLIAFGALDRVGARGRVIFSDVSEPLLHRCRALAVEAGVADRCQFVPAAAEDLGAVPSASVDVVTTRSVLIYVGDKERALREFHRVLRPGGRLSIFEPINRFGHPGPRDRLWGYDVGPVADLADKVKAVYERAQPSGSDPMLDFDERDLIRFTEAAGFTEIHAALEVMIAATPVIEGGWMTLLRFAGNPRAPTLEEAITEALTREEAARVEVHLRPLVERGEGETRSAVLYLTARA